MFQICTASGMYGIFQTVSLCLISIVVSNHTISQVANLQSFKIAAFFRPCPSNSLVFKSNLFVVDGLAFQGRAIEEEKENRSGCN